MKYDVLYNFISPITGRLLIQEGYILIGNSDGFSIESPILIDMRLDLLNLRRDIDEVFATSFIIGFPNTDFPQAQVLSELEDGFMYNTAGVVSTSATIPLPVFPNLTYKNLWIGNSSNRPEETQTIQIFNFPNLTSGKLWIGNSPNRPEEINTLPLNNLPNLTQNYLWTGNANNKPVETETLVVDNLPGLFFKAIWRGTITGRPEATEDLTELELKVTLIEDFSIPALEVEIAALEVEIAALEVEIAALEAEIAALEAEILAVGAEVDIINVEIVAINLAIATLNVTLNGDVTGSGNIHSPIVTTLQLTLNEIKIAQDTVNLNNQKISNLKSDEVEQQDALNAKFLWDLMHDQVEVVWV